MNILAPFYSGDVVLMGIFSIMILISVHNWCIAIFKFYMIKKQKKLDKATIEKDLNLEYSKDLLGLELAYKNIESLLEIKRNYLEKHIGFLATSASTTPFIGLLGTVWGIAKALKAIAISGNASLSVISGPIGEALISTAVGLFVAIPASVFYNTILAQIEEIVAENKKYFEMQVIKYFKK